MAFGLRVQDGDIVWSGGALQRVTDPLEAVRQLLESRMLLAAGEWFLDPAEGLPLYEKILGKPRSESVIRQVLRDRILQTPGVMALKSLTVSIDPSARTLSASYDAQASMNGTTGTVSGTVQIG
jgi:hypothetical protein